MLRQDELEAIARVMVAREAGTAGDLDAATAARAYASLLTVEDAHLIREDADVAEEWDRGQAVEDGVRRVLREGSSFAWPLLKMIVELCPPDGILLAGIGAGLFEDWVTEERVDAVASELQALVRCDPKWRTVVESSWDEPPSLVRLLAALSKPPSRSP